MNEAEDKEGHYPERGVCPGSLVVEEVKVMVLGQQCREVEEKGDGVFEPDEQRVGAAERQDEAE